MDKKLWCFGKALSSGNQGIFGLWVCHFYQHPKAWGDEEMAKQELTEVQDKELLLRVAFGRVDA